MENNQLETGHVEPQILGADNARRLMTYAYGLLKNGYSSTVVVENVNTLFRTSLTEEDILRIESNIEFEASIADIKLGN